MGNGIIEKIVAEKMGFEFDQYNTSNAAGAIISPEDFAKYIDIIKGMEISIHQNGHVYQSGLEGIYTYLSMFNIDDDLIDEITGSEVKQTELYLTIREKGSLPRDRIDVDHFLDQIGKPESEPELEPEPEPELIKRLWEIFRVYNIDGNVISGSNKILSLRNLKKLHDKTGKIIFDTGLSYEGVISILVKKGVSTKEIKDNIIIINPPQYCTNSAIVFGFNCLYTKHNKGSDKIFKDIASNIVVASLDGACLNILVSRIDRFFNIILDRWHGIDYETQLKEDVRLANSYNGNLTNDVSKVVIKNSNSLISELKNTYNDVVKKIQSKQEELTNAIKEHRKIKGLLESYDNGGEESKISKAINSDIKELLALKQIRSMFLEDSTLIVNTNEINTIDDRSKKYHNIGVFAIKIPLNDSHNIKIINTKYSIIAYGEKVMQAPHVFENGSTCQGNIAIAISNYHANMEIYNLVYALIMFLESANTDDPAGEYISAWPEVSEDEIAKMDGVAMKDKSVTIDIGEPDEDEVDFISSIQVERK